MDWRKSDLSKVEVGDFVFTLPWGWQKVRHVHEPTDNFYCPIATKRSYYSMSGELRTDGKYPTAWTECPFPNGPSKPVNRPDFEPDHPLKVWRNKNSFHRRHFARWPNRADNEGVFCWDQGKTSFTSHESCIIHFPFWSDAEENK